MLYLGIGDPGWIGRPELDGVPLFVSRNRLAGRRTINRANGPVAIDSGGFTELKNHGRWRITPVEYVAELRRYVAALGPDNVRWIAPQDWMCEPIVINGGRTKDGIFAGTGLDVAEHQRRTVANFLELRALAPELPIAPVIQGWTLPDYLRCIDLYRQACVDLRGEPLVGLGSVCRRQASDEIDLIVSTIAAMGIRLHGFGVKTAGVESYGPLLESADSQAWSYAARMRHLRCSHPGRIRHECNCPVWAASWHRDVAGRVGLDAQPALDLFGAEVAA